MYFGKTLRSADTHRAKWGPKRGLWRLFCLACSPFPQKKTQTRLHWNGVSATKGMVCVEMLSIRSCPNKHELNVQRIGTPCIVAFAENRLDGIVRLQNNLMVRTGIVARTENSVNV